MTAYIHPLVQRSSSSLSKKSLEICTESLGCETGSERLPSYQSSEAKEGENTKPQPQPQKGKVQVQVLANYSISKACRTTRNFPPSIPSLQIHSHRVSGRVVLEASLFPPSNVFSTQRLGGRLRLTLNDQETLVIDQENNQLFNKFQKQVEVTEMAPTNVSHNIMAKSLLKPLTTSTSGFEYSWGIKSYFNSTSSSTKPEASEEQELEVLRGNDKKDSLVLLLRGCKESKRSFLIWEPYCFATS